jgi:hypothetical protein
MTTRALACTALFLLVPGGCSTSHAVRGAHAEREKDYVAAREAYRRELNSAQADDDKTTVSRFRILMATYELGRMTGYTCDYVGAETLLREALRLSELMEERYSHRTAILSELARLTFDAGKLADSVSFYERAIERLDGFRHVDRDPIGFAEFLDDYALALERAGSVSAAARVRARTHLIRLKNVGKAALFTPLHYRDLCGQESR